MPSSPSSILMLVISFIVGFYLLGSLYQPLENAGVTLQNQLGANIVNESLGTCGSSGDCTFYTDYKPIKSGSWTVYADGTPHTSWVNATVAVTLSNGLVNITATGTNPTTANAAITIDYQRQPEITNITALNSLPGVAILIFVLLVVAGFIIAASRGV